mmetsp:Transcript_36407/g.109307  ORF Transcript_36407/g.109307 Transcript_36407/m.109307 type:complete len:92 (-) Transcript_36407:2830-3105(-)
MYNIFLGTNPYVSFPSLSTKRPSLARLKDYVASAAVLNHQKENVIIAPDKILIFWSVLSILFPPLRTPTSQWSQSEAEGGGGGNSPTPPPS